MNISVVYACDEGFSEVFATSLYSLLSTNTQNDIVTYLIADQISEEHTRRLKEISDSFHQELVIIPAPNINNMTTVDVDCKQYSLSAFSRFFVGTLIPKEVDTVLYLDCDTLILDDLSELINISKAHPATFSVVSDYRSFRYARNLGIQRTHLYFNSGVLVIKLDQYREKKYEELLLKYISFLNGRLEFPDNDILCMVAEEDVQLLPIRYNLTSIFCACSYEELKRIRASEEILEEIEFETCKENPCIVHFTRCFLLAGRPWEQGFNGHPYSHIYDTFWNKAVSTQKKINYRQKSLLSVFANIAPRGLVVRAAGVAHSVIKPNIHWFATRYCRKMNELLKNELN